MLIVATVGVLAIVVIYPILILVINSFVVSRPWEVPRYGLDAWRFALLDRGMLAAMWNTIQLAVVH